MRTYYVYIMESRSRVLYTGVTNDLARRVDEHKRSLTPGFTSRYHITRLVYFEEFGDVRDAIAREKQLKGWVRSRKTRYARDAKDLLDLRRYGVGSFVTAAWNSGRYRPYPSASRRSTGMNRRAAEFMQ